MAIVGRQVLQKSSDFLANILDDSATQSACELLLNIFESSFGIHGKCKMFHNGLGGHVTLTSSSARIFQVIHLKTPILSVIKSAVQSHLRTYNDCGSLIVCLTLYIVNNIIELGINRHLATEVLDRIFQEIIQFMTSEHCIARVKVSFDKLDQLLKIVSGVTSKPGCLANSREIQHVNLCIVKTYLKTCMNSNSETGIDNVQFLCCEGTHMEDSCVLDGLLIEACHIPVYRLQNIKINQVKNQDGSYMILSVVCNTSLAGEFCNNFDGEYESSSKTVLEKVNIDKMLDVARYLVNRQIGIVLCQKVMHPKVKRYFKDHGVEVIDRLGKVQTEKVLRLTGGQCISSLVENPDEKTFGSINIAEHRVLNNRSYLLLNRHDASVPLATVILCGLTEESLAELRQVYMAGLCSLQHVSVSQSALYGAGAWQLELAKHLRQVKDDTLKKWCEDIKCNLLQVRNVVNVVADAFDRQNNLLNKEKVNLEDIVSSLTSALDEKSDFKSSLYCSERSSALGVLDAEPSVIGAIHTSMFLCNMILSVVHYISDTS